MVLRKDCDLHPDTFPPCSINSKKSFELHSVSLPCAINSKGNIELQPDIFPCYNEEKQKEEDVKMSLVGIIVNDKGIVAFGERKSVKLVQNVPYHVGYVKKVFKGGDFLFVTSGENELSSLNGTISLETIINQLSPEKYFGYEKFFSDLSCEINKYAITTIPQIHFLIGTKKKFVQYNKPHFENIIIEYTYQKNPVQYTYYFGENARFSGFIDYLPRVIPFHHNWTVNQLSEVAKDIVKNSVKYSEQMTKDHSPIGGEIDVLTLE